MAGPLPGTSCKAGVGKPGAFWRRPLKTPALPCSPAIPGRADGWAGNDHPVVSFPTTGGWQQWLPLVAAIMAPCGHLAASSHAGRARGPGGEQNTAGANLGISTPGRRGATTGWKEGADAPPVVRCQPLRLGFGTRCTDHQDGGVAGGRTGAQDRNGDERRRFPSCPTTALVPSLARACVGR